MKSKISALIVLMITLVASPAWAVPQEGAAEPGEGLTALQTVLYFFIAPLSLFLAIVIIGYAIHRPREGKNKPSNLLTEIR